jgi:membrane protein implicated in regulation of membrane protease activity
VRETTMQEWAIRILAPLTFFLAGYADLKILKSRGVACMTWFIGGMIAAFCVAYLPLPAPIGIIVGCVVFLCGVVALAVFYRRRPRQ